MAWLETNTSNSQETPNKTQEIISQIKWFFSKFTSKKWEEKKHRTNAFKLSFKDAIITLIISICIVAWACFYWFNVINKYSEINSKSDELKNISTYNISSNGNIDQYTEWNNKDSIAWMIEINNIIMELLANREYFQKEQKNYYEVLLQNIYLPSLNVWKNPYTKHFDVTILWERYLNANKFEDLYLIQYRSDFVKYVWNDAEYNTIENIGIWDIVEVPDTDYFYIPITVSFSSPNKRSFLLLVNKLSMTSNINNISLVNEFFFYLLMNIKEKKSDVIEELMQQYRPDFSSSSARDWPSNISDLTDEQRLDYRDKVIWYELYNWVNYEWAGTKTTPLIDDELIVETIKESTMCDQSISDSECFYNFRDKYRNLPYLAYKIWMGNQANRANWFRNFLKDLPPIIAITSFSFSKNSDSASFLNNNEEEYAWNLTFNAYWKTISSDELNEAAIKLWNLCFGESANQPLFPDIALDRVNNAISSLWWWDENVNISSLLELQWIFEEMNNEYFWMDQYKKIIKVFESWRMLNDANLCNY